MTTNDYTVTLYAKHIYAVEEIAAETAEDALAQARVLLDKNPFALDWNDYDSPDHELDQITVEGPDDDCAEWLSPDETLAQAASDLLEALELAVTALNTAPRFIVRVQGTRTDSYDIAAVCDRAIAKAKGT